MTTTLLLVHGWGFDRTFWGPLTSCLPGLPTLTWDLGFFGQSEEPVPPTAGPDLADLADLAVLAVGHSLGLMRLVQRLPTLREVLPRLVGLVSLCGFTRFAQTPAFPQGVHPRVLRLMHRRLAQGPLETRRLLMDFYTSAGFEGPSPGGEPDAARLAQGLEELMHQDVTGLLLKDLADLPKLALASADDRIAPEPLSRACWEEAPNARLVMAARGGHCLPWTDPAWCAGQILKFLEPTGLRELAP